MPTIPASQMNDIAREQRQKLKALMDEKRVLSLGFSYRELRRLLRSLGVNDDERVNSLLESCVLAFNDTQEEEVTKQLKEEIGGLLLDNDVTTLQFTDPFKRVCESLIYTSKTPRRLVTGKLVDNAPDYGISTKKITELIEASMSDSKEYTQVVVRESKAAPAEESKSGKASK